MTTVEELYVLVQELKYQLPDPITNTFVVDKLNSILKNSELPVRIQSIIKELLVKQRTYYEFINDTINTLARNF